MGQLFIASLTMAAVVLIDIAIPRGKLRFDREAFYLSWPVAEMVTHNGIFCREIHVIFLGYEVHVAWLDNLYFADSSRVRSIKWADQPKARK